MTPKTSSRLLSLDVFRGITIAGMLIVNSPGNGTAYPPLEHAEWNGYTPTDLVFPFFLFIVGVSIVFSFFKRREAGTADRDLYAQIFKRTVLIFGLGLLLNGFPYNHLGSIRIPGVLQRIALCYFFSSLLFLNMNVKKLIGVTAALLVGYAGWMRGDLSPEGNLAGHIDRIFFTGHMWTSYFDPEGILSTLPAIATTLLGVLTGLWLKTSHDASKKIRGMVAAGMIGIILGEIWGRWFPINKSLWTSSYVLVTGGDALLLLAFCYGLIEVKNYRGWSRFFEVFGMNGLAAYALPLFLLKTMNRIPMANPDGSMGNSRLFITRHLFESWTTPMNASLLFALSHTLLWFVLLYALFRKRIFIKI